MKGLLIFLMIAAFIALIILLAFCVAAAAHELRTNDDEDEGRHQDYDEH